MSGPRDPKKPDPKKLAEESRRNASLRFESKEDEERAAMAERAAQQAKVRAGKGPVGAGAAKKHTPPPLPPKSERERIRSEKKGGSRGSRSDSDDSNDSGYKLL